MSRLHDRSTEAVKRSLRTPKSRNPVTSHEGVASVGAAGAQPTPHNCDCGPNAAANEAFNESVKGPRLRPNTIQVGGR